VVKFKNLLFCVNKGRANAFKRNVKREHFEDRDKYDRLIKDIDNYLKKFELDEG